MPEPRRPAQLVALGLAGLLAACTPAATPSASARPSPSTFASAVAPSATPDASPTATPEPPLSLEPPSEVDPRAVTLGVTPAVAADGDGTITVSVTNESESRIDELVLRWPTALDATLFLAPFARDPGRIADGGPPLVQPWSKWVVGPGERGEPAGTTSLGWGPLDTGATLDIPVVVTRRAGGPVAFDLQVLAENAILSTADGEPAEARIQIP
jgi:hypothetical protein